MGIYYAAPLLGPSMGPLLGGILTQVFNWRATFWFLAIFGGVSLATFVVFKDTFRRERSLTYQAALKKMKAQLQRKPRTAIPESQTTTIAAQPADEKQCPEGVGKPETHDLEAQRCKGPIGMPLDMTGPQSVASVKLTLKEVNPITPLVLVLRRRNNVTILIASGECH